MRRFALAGLNDAEKNAVLEALDGEVVLRGKLGKVDAASRTRAFLVSEAWRGLPGVRVSATDVFYAVDSRAAVVRCASAPCMSETAKSLNSTTQRPFSSYAFRRALKPSVDEMWVRHLVMNRGALVAAQLKNGAPMTVGNDVVLDVNQVFIKLPERRSEQCPPLPLAPCPDGLENVFERTAERCEYPAGCVTPGMCTLGFPSCEAGYALQGWKEAPHACTAYTCEPDFTL